MDSKLIATLRRETGAGIVDCQKALTDASGDMEKAKALLKERGIVKAGKKQDRQTSEGIVASYIHGNKKVGVMVVLSCETDFVARNEAFLSLAQDICMHIAASAPQYLNPESIPADIVAVEKQNIEAQLRQEGKKEEMIGKITEGKLAKLYEDLCLLNQKFIKDDSITIAQLIAQNTAVIGEKIAIREFKRFVV